VKENEALLEEIARLKKQLAKQEERVRVLESLNHEERIRKLESLLEFKQKIREHESNNVFNVESPKYEDNNNNNNMSAYDCGTCQPETGAHSRPTVLSIPFTPPKEPCKVSKAETLAAILPQLPFSGTISSLSNFLSTPINAMGYELPSPMATAQSLASLPPVRVLTSLSKWGPFRALSSSLMSSLTPKSPSDSPSQSPFESVI
jgi:hypothetical protein